MPATTVSERTLEAQAILFVRRELAHRDEIAAAIGASLGAVFQHCQAAGLQFAGPPFARYAAFGPEGITVESGMPLTAPADGAGEIEAGFLQAGRAAFCLHEGDYAELEHSYKAIERWVEANGEQFSGPCWESYLTDPAEHEDPADWRTEIYWPIADRDQA